MENRDHVRPAQPEDGARPPVSELPGRASKSKNPVSLAIGGSPFGPQLIVFHSLEDDPKAEDPNP